MTQACSQEVSVYVSISAIASVPLVVLVSPVTQVRRSVGTAVGFEFWLMPTRCDPRHTAGEHNVGLCHH